MWDQKCLGPWVLGTHHHDQLHGTSPMAPQFETVRVGNIVGGPWRDPPFRPGVWDQLGTMGRHPLAEPAVWDRVGGLGLGPWLFGTRRAFGTMGVWDPQARTMHLGPALRPWLFGMCLGRPQFGTMGVWDHGCLGPWVFGTMRATVWDHGRLGGSGVLGGFGGLWEVLGGSGVFWCFGGL